MTVWSSNCVIGDTYIEVCCQRYVEMCTVSQQAVSQQGSWRLRGRSGLTSHPSGFSYNLHSCLQEITTSTQVLDGSLVESTDVLTPVSTVTAAHQPYTVMWAERDLTLFAPDVSASRMSIVLSAHRQQTAMGNGPTTTSLPPGAIVATVIAVGLAIILTTLVMRCVIHMKSKKAPKTGLVLELDGVQTGTWKRWHRGAWRAELNISNARTELDSSNVRAEADSRNVRAELDVGNVKKDLGRV